MDVNAPKKTKDATSDTLHSWQFTGKCWKKPLIDYAGTHLRLWWWWTHFHFMTGEYILVLFYVTHLRKLFTNLGYNYLHWLMILKQEDGGSHQNKEENVLYPLEI